MTRTGRSNSKCYAGVLQDCSGDITGEHMVTEALLLRLVERWGSKGALTVEGLPWARTARRATPEMLQSNVLCAKHNEALSDFDAESVRLFDALMDLHEGRPQRTTINGDYLERWSLKVLAGFVASGNVAVIDGGRLPKDMPGAGYLNALFGGGPIRSPWGFYFIDRSDEPEPFSKFEFRIHEIPEGLPGAGTPWGITVQLLGLTWTTALATLNVSNAYYRPAGFDFEQFGALELSWRDGAAIDVIPLASSRHVPRAS